MLDIKFLREQAEAVRSDLKRRKDATKIPWVDEILAKDVEWRKLKQENDDLRAERNRLSEQVNATKKAGGDIAPLLAKVKAIPAKIQDLDDQMRILEEEIRNKLMRLPNLMHESVPQGETDEDNLEIKLFGKKPTFAFTPKNHNDLIIGLADLERAAKIAGSRFYFLEGDLALLEHSLQRYAIEFMVSKGYTFVQPPYLMNRAAYEGVTDLADFEDVLYKIEGEDLHLIATSEHPLTAQFKDEVLDANALPIKLAAVSPCFRKETGTHGKEEKGIWRVHQFTKVEQVIVCKPEDSWDLHEEIIGNAIAFFESLDLHFRQVLICTGDLGTVAAKKYDLEAWIPSVEKYKEVVSGSNCTAYQATRLNIKYRDGGENRFVHTLNSTCVATSRALVAILEQNQLEDGTIAIPKALQKYMGKTTIAPSR